MRLYVNDLIRASDDDSPPTGSDLWSLSAWLVVMGLLPSVLVRGPESRIYSHKVRMYVRTCICTWWVTFRNVMRNVLTYHRHRY